MVKEELEKLLELQQLDTEIATLQEEIASLPERLKTLAREIDRHTAELEKTKKERTRFKVDRREQEGELKAVEEEMKKLQKVLNEVKTNKEYNSVLAEIKSLEAKQSQLEEKVLIGMEAEDELARKEASGHALLEEEKKKFASAEKEEREKVAQLQVTYAQKTSERDGKLAGVDAGICRLYEKIKKSKKDGIAICRLEGSSGRETCAGCSVFVPTYLIEKVKKKTEVVQCENCSRILY